MEGGGRQWRITGKKRIGKEQSGDRRGKKIGGREEDRRGREWGSYKPPCSVV